MRPVTGIYGIDRTHRLLPGKLYFLVGRFSGEDWLATRIAHRNALTLGGRIVVVSPNRPKSDLLDELASIEAGTDIARLRGGDSADQERAEVATAAVTDASIAVVDDDSAHPMVMFEIYHRARELGGVDLLVVMDLDALASHTDCICGSHASALAQLRLLKALAEHFSAPVVGVARARRRFNERRILRASDIKGGHRVSSMADGVVLVRQNPDYLANDVPPVQWMYRVAPDARAGSEQHAGGAALGFWGSLGR